MLDCGPLVLIGALASGPEAPQHSASSSRDGQVVAWLSSIIECVSEIIDDGFGAWGEGEWEGGGAAMLHGQNKRRSMDYHVKQYALRDAVRSWSASSASGAVRSLSNVHASIGCRWLQTEMASFRAACMLSFNPTMSIGIAIDATRVGKPAKEVLCGFATNASSQMHAALPPQVNLGTSHIPVASRQSPSSRTQDKLS